MIAERRAAERVGSLLSKYARLAWLTQEAWTYIASKCVANRIVLRGIFDELDAPGSGALGDRGKVLRQQSTASLDDQDWILERLHEIGQERDRLVGWLRQMGSPYVDRYDADEVAADREDAKAREAAQDAAAGEAMPRVAS